MTAPLSNAPRCRSALPSSPVAPGGQLEARLRRMDWYLGAYLVSLASAVAGAVSIFLLLLSLHGAVASGAPDPWGQGLAAWLVSPASLALMAAYVLGQPAALTLFLLSMANMRRIACMLGISGFRYGWGWTVGSFFVPLWCYYRPWVGLAEIRRAAIHSAEAGQAGTAWQYGTSWPTVALMATHLANMLVLFLSDGNGTLGTLTPEAVTRDLYLQGAALFLLAWTLALTTWYLWTVRQALRSMRWALGRTPAG